MATTFDLPKWELTVLRGLAPNNEQVPAAGASVAFYREGATVTTGTTIAAGGGVGVIAVRDAGAIRNGDTLFKNTNTGAVLLVTAVPGALGLSLSVQNNGGAPFQVDPGDRLTPLTNRPAMFSDERSAAAVAGPAITLDANGYGEVYGYQFDAIASGGGLVAPQRLMEQEPIGGVDVIDPRKWDVRANGSTDDTAAMQACLDYVNARGGEGPQALFIPGQIVISAALTVACPNLYIFGHSRRRAQIIQTTAGAAILSVTGSRVTLKSMTLVRFAGNAALSLNAAVGSDDLILRDVEFIGVGLGMDVLSSRCRLESVIFSVAFPGATRILRVTGASADTFHGDFIVTGGSGLQGIVIENGAKRVRIKSPDLGTGVFISGASTEDVVFENTRVSPGITAVGFEIDAGKAIRFINTYVQDALKGYQCDGGQEVAFVGCGAVGCRRESWDINAVGATDVVSLSSCFSSDASQEGANTFDHMNIIDGAQNVFVEGFRVGNHIRGSATVARHGVSIEGTLSVASIKGITRVAGGGVTGNVLNVANTAILGNSTVDLSHNGSVINGGTSVTFGAKDHISGGAYTITETTGGTLDLTGVGGVIVNSAGPITFTTATAGYRTQEVTIFNKGAGSATINHVGGTIENIGAAAVVLATGEKVRYTFIDGMWKQTVVKVAA